MFCICVWSNPHSEKKSAWGNLEKPPPLAKHIYFDICSAILIYG